MKRKKSLGVAQLVALTRAYAAVGAENGCVYRLCSREVMPSLKSRGCCVTAFSSNATGESLYGILLPDCRVGSFTHLTFSEVRM